MECLGCDQICSCQNEIDVARYFVLYFIIRN
jgi:hypothetical protein